MATAVDSRSSSNPSLAVIEDDEIVRRSIRLSLRRLTSQIFEFESAAAAEAGLAKTAPDVVLLDLGLPDRSALEALDGVRRWVPDAPVIVVTGRDDAETAAEAIRHGACDYITKPFSPEELSSAVRRVCDAGVQLGEATAKKRDDIVGPSSSMREAMDWASETATGTESVLITGEPGVGKELLGKRIHRRSRFRNGEFVVVDGAVDNPETILGRREEAERRAAITRAEGGTLFVSNADKLDPTIQVRLAEHYREEAVGGRSHGRLIITCRSAEPRGLSSSLRSLTNATRRDLPTLRQRQQDILYLADYFLGKEALDMATAAPKLAPEVAALLENYEWPGNVRELAAVMENAFASVDDGVVRISDLPAYLVEEQRHPDETVRSCSSGHLVSLTDLQRAYVELVIHRSAGNIDRAARTLHVQRRTLHEMIGRFGLAGLGSEGKS